MAKTSERPCIAYQREPLPLFPSALKEFPNELHNTLQAPKSRAKLASARQHLHSCLTLPFPPLLSLLPIPLRQVAISHYPRLKRLQGVAASASSSLTNNTPTTTRTTTTAHRAWHRWAALKRARHIFALFCKWGCTFAAPSPCLLLPLLPVGSSVQKLHQIHENIFQKLH